MKYIETKLSFNDFVALIKQANPYFNPDHDAISECAVDFETLDAEMQDYPAFYYYSDLNGKNYVLEENENNNCSVVYEVTEIDENNESPCEIILRDTVGMWDGEAYENLALYGLSAKLAPADENATSVSVWIEFCYSSTTSGAPTDRYVRGVDVDQFSDDYDRYEFDTYADAQAWIDSQESGTYYLAHGEMDRPKYTIV